MLQRDLLYRRLTKSTYLQFVLYIRLFLCYCNCNEECSSNIKQTCRVDVCASSARQTGSCWQDEGNFPRCTYRIPLHQKIAPYIISCCGPRICKGGIFLCKKAQATSFPGSLNHPANSRRSPPSLPAPCSAHYPLYLDTTLLRSHQT